MTYSEDAVVLTVQRPGIDPRENCVVREAAGAEFAR